ncbi:MAG: DPP IV N-terminal domain-containing protein, partial [Sedimentisphaerales bacterium]|nr:DPP IV N-terminal domain-containing protein [Sedimentisphaerales bacterium]
MINMHPKPGISGKTAVFAVLAVGSLNVLAGDIRSNYQHALNLSKTTAGKVFRQRVGPNWFAGNSKFWYRNDLPGGVREFILVDAEKGTRQSAFDHTRLAEALSAILQRKVDPGRIDIGNLDFDLSGPTMSFSCEGKPFTCDLQDYKMQQADGNSVPDSSLKSIGRIRPSRRTGPETSITFVNRRDNDIDIYWVNPERQRQHYANLKPGDEHRQHTYTGHVWLVLDDQDRTLGVYEATEEEDLVVIDSNSPVVLQPRRPRRSPQSDRSPDGKWRALIENNNLILRKLDDQSERPMTEDGTPEDYYAAPFYWSPDSRKLVVLKTKKADERKVNLIESSPEDQLQPRLHTFTYAKPGDKIDQPRPHLFDIEKAEEIDVSDELFANPWSISDIRWAPDSKRFTF